ncbi:sensor histidine kinase [Curtobacterium sp. ME12]|uniref:sensor histidine kinase n=1 Tax=Curtobacterium sp. ME12 TaxID=2744253 RepID=UPI0015F4C723|nr:sensor histidine kinase [Curtobacterium sp. ME12]
MNGSFKFAPEILRRLGEELNPSIDQGILELVKNAYDADAENVVVEIQSTGRGRVSVTDDGIGMSVDQILNGWLVLGSSSKTSSSRTGKGRAPAGNKGLGRLAALRLGETAVLRSRKKGDRNASTVTLDWREFDAVDTVDEVIIPIGEADVDIAHGSEIVVSDLRRRIGRMDVKRVARSLILLADPFVESETAFKPRLRAPEFEDLERLVDARYFEDANYHLIAEVIDGVARARVLDWRGLVLFETSGISTEFGGTRTYDIPDATFELWTFSLSAATFVSRTTSVGEVREWLNTFGGVHVYLNGLRVNPYGNPGNDWLDMNLARARNPEERPSTNTSIGRVKLNYSGTRLTEKTDRSGFVENDAFETLKEFGRDALDWMARRRLAIAEERRRATRVKTSTRSAGEKTAVNREIARVPSSERRGELERVFKRYDSARESEVRALRKEVQLYRTLSTAGITTATFAHEASGNTVKLIEIATNAIEVKTKRELGEAAYSGVIEKSITAIRRATRSIGVLAQATLRLIDGEKRRVGRVDLNSSIQEVLDTYSPFLEGRKVTVETTIAADEAFVQGSEAALESIVANLINNSLSIFEQSATEDRRVRISTYREESSWYLEVCDSGPGIVGISTRDIWLPGESRRPGGTGLGLTIVRDAVADLGGKISVDASGPMGGAAFTVRLPILNRD